MGVLEEIQEKLDLILVQQEKILRHMEDGRVAEPEYLDMDGLKARWNCAYFSINKAMKNGLFYRKFGRKTMFPIEEVKRYEKEKL